MDIETALIGVTFFIVSAGVLLVISMFTTKEKSYEEALAEQRQQANALLGVSTRSKPKEKKLKKANKKVKEKQSTVPVESETAEESEDTESLASSVNPLPKPHVEFKEPTATEAAAAEAPEKPAPGKQRRGKKDKVRPILVHKPVENPVITDPLDVPPANHFEQLHPKDEFELLHSQLHTKEDVPVKTEPLKEKQFVKSKQNGLAEVEVAKEKGGQKANHNPTDSKEVKNKQEQAKDKKEKQNEPNKDKKQPEPLKEKKEKQPESSVKDKKEKQPLEPAVKEKACKDKQVTSSPESQKQKKTPKLAAAPQPVAEKEEPAVEIVTVVPQANGYVAGSGKEKKKKKNEVNVLQQISGAKDGDVNLSLLLNVVRKAELSRSEVQILIDLLLNKQHEAPAVLDEWSEGKTDPIQKLKKQLAEKEKALAEEQEAVVGAQAKLREIRAEQATEKSQMQQRLRGLEEALQAKHLELQTANSRLHSQNQKMQQMQAQLNEEGLALRKLREENSTLQLQRQQIDIHISQVQEAENTIQDLQSRNNQLTMDLHALTEQNLATKEHQQGLIVQLQHQVNHFKNELDEKENFARQFEEMRRDLEHRLGLAHRQENELKVELSQLKSACQQNVEEIRRLEHGKGQAQEEVRSLQKQKDELDHIILQLKSELRDVQTEKSELQMLKANGMAQENEMYKEELLNLHNQLSSVKSELQSVEKQYLTELETFKTSVKQLQAELEDQRTKNNELRKKNWKVMDALKAAEGRTAESAKALPVNLDELLSRARTEEQEANKKFIQRLFPDIDVKDSASYDQWTNNVEKAIQQYICSLEQQPKTPENSEVAKLQTQVQHYKTVIDDTEGILKKLQNHIEQEEIHWRKELKAKEVEIELLKQQHLLELQTKVQQLESKLLADQEALQRMTEAYELQKSRSSSHADPAVIEKLSEEVNRLNEQLFIERRKNSESVQHLQIEANDVCIKEQNGSTNGPSIPVNAN